MTLRLSPGWWIIPALVFGVALWVALILFLLS